MRRLLSAELRKLRRPLVVWTIVAVGGMSGALAWNGQRSISGGLSTLPAPPENCAQISMQPGPECDRVRTQIADGYRQAQMDDRASLARESPVLLLRRHPVGAAAVAAGQIASLVGLLALALLGGAHIGGEWSGGTVTWLVLRARPRWRAVLAKVISLWSAGIALLLFAWLVDATVGRLPAPVSLVGHGPALGEALATALRELGKCAVVLLFFSCLVTLCGVLTRGALATVGVCVAAFAVAAMLTTLATVAAFSPVTWIAGAMGFVPGAGNVSRYLWKDTFPSGASVSTAVGLLALVAASLVTGLAAAWRFAKLDISA